MSPTRPRATVVVATHNGQAFLERTLASVLAQTLQPIQVVVCDDGSTDGTPELLERWVDRVTVLRQHNRGVSAARNHGARLARGPYLAFLDHDDVWEPGLLERQTATLAARPECGLVYADSWIIDDADRVHGTRARFLDYREGDVFAELLRGNFIPIETAVMPTAVFRALGGFDERLRFLEDYELYLRLAARHPVAFQPEPLARYRIHEHNLSHQRRALLEEWVAVLETLLLDPGRPAEQRALLAGEVATRAGEVAWQALKAGDLEGADAWLARAGERCPARLHMRVALGRAVLGAVPRPLAELARRALPRLSLYGVRGRPSRWRRRGPAR